MAISPPSNKLLPFKEWLINSTIKITKEPRSIVSNMALKAMRAMK